MGGVKRGFTLINESTKDNGSKVSHVRKSKAVNYENGKKNQHGPMVLDQIWQYRYKHNGLSFHTEQN